VVAKPALSESIQDYLKAIYKLQDATGRVTITAVARDQHVSAASASAMLKKLGALGLLDHEPYRGARLTEAGERVAVEVIRHHRLLELFLAEVLEMPWDRVHSEAEVLEHHISEELEELIAAKLGQPRRDPHGDPIPDRDLEVTTEDSVALSELEPGERGVFARVSDSDSSMLRYLAEREIQPGDSLVVSSREPFGGPVMVEIGGRTHPLGAQLAESIRVRRESADE
jgi:DtxR family Mn-dependent transcriptional regulator